MSEIEKMYKNAGIRPNYIDACTVEDKYWQNEELANEYGTFDMYMNAKCGHQEDCTTLCSCAYTKEEYPPFTAEKQVELIKWLARKDYGDYTSSLLINITDNLVYFSAGAKSNYCAIEVLYDSNKCTDFENALAGLINNLWQDLTEEEKQQVKGILNGN